MTTLKFIRNHLAVITYSLGSSIIAVWTVLRFVTHRTIFDLVGQQVIAQQLIAGQGGNAEVGVTNYLLKLIFLYVPLDVLPGDPRLKLLLLTLLINIATFLLIGLLLKKILCEFKVRIGWQFYAVLLWLAVIAGSVFWIQFTNSRNLEVAGGLLLIVLVLRFLKLRTWRRAVGLLLYTGILFFADNLQLYMTAVPLLAYAGIMAVAASRQYKPVVWLALLFTGGFVLSKVCSLCCALVLNLDYIPASGALQLSDPVGIIKGTAQAYKHLLLGGVDAGRFRQAANGLLLLGFLVATVLSVVRRQMKLPLVLLALCIVGIDTAVFMVSGYPTWGGAERYLIMTVPAAMLVFSALPSLGQYSRLAALGVSLVVLINIVSLGSTLAFRWPDRFAADDHTITALSYTPQNTRVYAGMDTAIAGAYLGGSYKDAALPLSCSDKGTLHRTNTFYAEEAYAAKESQAAQYIAVVLDPGMRITNIPAICTKATIEAQLGTPLTQDTLPDGTKALIYPAQTANKF